MIRIKISLFIVFILLSAIPFQNASAYDAVVEVGLNLAQNTLSRISGAINQVENTLTEAATTEGWLYNKLEASLLPMLKQQAIQAINNSTLQIISKGNNGKPYVITNWRTYLYNEPKNKATITANSFLDQMLGGKSSSLNYSNSDYYSYLKQQALAYANPDSIKTNLTAYIANPRDSIVSGGNLIAFNKFFETGNNPYSVASKYAEVLSNETEKEQKQALEKQANGFLPMEDSNGKIITPAALFENAIQSASGMANEMVTNATKSSELLTAVINSVYKTVTNSLTNGLLK